MRIETLKEPRLQFADGVHICPRKGIETYGVFDKSMTTRRTSINIGGVGSSNCLEMLDRWLQKCTSRIESPVGVSQPNLHTAFCGFNAEQGFYSRFVFDNELCRKISNSDLSDIVAIKDRDGRVEKAIDLYYEEVKFLAQNRVVDVIVCVVPEMLYEKISLESLTKVENNLEVSVQLSAELNFRRALKAKTMHLGKPLQLIRATTLDAKTKGQQDEATKAWNFCTALYYKAGATNPWKLVADKSQTSSCAVGIAFYRSRNREVLQTSLAQIFDELGNGLILRGTPVDMRKDDRVPHLTTSQAYELLTTALTEYRVALRTYPARVVIHKSSNYSDEEMEGLMQAARDLKKDSMDFVTVMDAKIKILREGNYPPFRGSMVSLDDKRHLLYTRGSVWYYRTYPGMFIPQPLELRIVRSEESPNFLAREVLGLTKMNWNNTQFDGKYPVTLGCARKVGEIMKYLDEGERPQVRYGFYM